MCKRKKNYLSKKRIFSGNQWSYVECSSKEISVKNVGSELTKRKADQTFHAVNIDGLNTSIHQKKLT